MKRTLLVAAIAAALGGCYKAQIHLADGPGTLNPMSKHYHFSLIGFIEISKQVDLQATCPGGTAVIHDEVDFLGGLVNVVLGTYVPVLEVMTPSVSCAGGPAAPPPEGGAAPADGPPPPPAP